MIVIVIVVIVIVIVIVVTGGKQSQLLASALGLGWSLTKSRLHGQSLGAQPISPMSMKKIFSKDICHPKNYPCMLPPPLFQLCLEFG